MKENSVKRIREDWTDPVFQQAYQGGDIQDVLTLLENIDRLEAELAKAKEVANTAWQQRDLAVDKMKDAELQLRDALPVIQAADAVWCHEPGAKDRLDREMRLYLEKGYMRGPSAEKRNDASLPMETGEPWDDGIASEM